MLVVSRGVDAVDQRCHVLLVLKRLLKRLEERGEGNVRLRDLGKLDLLAVLVQVLAENQGMVALFGCLDLEVVRVAGKAFLLVVVGEGEVEICAVKLGVDLLVDQLDDIFLHGVSFLFGTPRNYSGAT